MRVPICTRASFRLVLVVDVSRYRIRADCLSEEPPEDYAVIVTKFPRSLLLTLLFLLFAIIVNLHSLGYIDHDVLFEGLKTLSSPLLLFCLFRGFDAIDPGTEVDCAPFSSIN